MRTPVLLLLLAALNAMPSAVRAASASCDEACMLAITAAYLDALTADQPSNAPLADRVRWTENGRDIAAGDGIWRTGKAWSYRHSFVDPVAGGIGVFGTVEEEGGKRAIVAVRLKVAGRRITESEVMVSREGDFSLFDTQATEPRAIFGRIVAPEDRSSRAQLKAIAASYFRGISQVDAPVVPFHPDCNRVENGVPTTNSPPRMTNSCSGSLGRFPYMRQYRQTRYPVVDTRRGLVLAITAFDMPELHLKTIVRGRPLEISPERNHLPRTMFLYELFKVEGGKIVQIEAEMRNEPPGTSMGWPPDR